MRFWQSNTENTPKAGKHWLNSVDLRKTSFVFACLSWIALLAFGLSEQSLNSTALPVKNEVGLRGLLLNAFIFNVYAFSWLRSKSKPLPNFYSSLWRALITGILASILSGLLNLLILWTDSSPSTFKILVHSFIFYVEFGMVLWMLISLLIKWKQAVLYERSKFVYYTWNIFEYTLFFATITHFFHWEEFNSYLYIAYGLLLITALVLCFNMRWVFKLSFKEKWQSILMLIGILGSLAYFLRNMLAHFSNEPLVVDDISKSVFVLALFSFDAAYALIAILVSIFNLPSASDFERKLKDFSSFQEMNNSLMKGKTRKEVYEQLLKTVMQVTHSDAGWVEASTDRLFIQEQISESDALRHRSKLEAKGFHSKDLRDAGNNYFLSLENKEEYNTSLAIPFHSGDTLVGTLVLLKRLGNAFDGAAIAMAQTCARQAGIALHNLELTEGSIGDGRFRKGLEVAKNVKKRLLPQSISGGEYLDIYAVSHSDDGIGGDYYDYFQLSESKFVFIIADVAGKGISAAFTMAQLKGIFQALAPQNLMPNEFLKQANAALSGCLEKGVFITASYYYIEAKESKVYFSRAGHCPTLYVDSLRDKVSYFENNGLGLGIITTDVYEQFIELNEFVYAPGDLMVLYTDGIVEASAPKSNEEYGYDRLQAYIEQHQQLSLPELADGIIKDVHSFIQAEEINDDYTVLLLKMR